MCGVFFACDSESVAVETIPALRFHQIILKHGDVYDLRDNPISGIDMDCVEYECNGLEIIDHILIATNVGDYTVSVHYAEGETIRDDSFNVQVLTYNVNAYFVYGDKTVKDVYVLSGHSIEVDLKGYGNNEVLFECSDNNVSYKDGVLTAGDSGEGVLHAYVIRNGVRVYNTDLDVHIVRYVDALDVDICVDDNPVTEVYKRSVEDSVFVDIRINNFVGDPANVTISGATVLSYDFDEDLVIHVRLSGLGRHDIRVYYYNIAMDCSEPVYADCSIDIYDYVNDIDITSNIDITDNRYIIYLASDMALAEISGYNTSMNITITSTNTGTKANYSVVSSNDNVVVDGTNIYAHAVGTSLLTVSALDGSEISRTIVIEVCPILVDSIVVSELEEIYYLKSGSSIRLRLPTVTLLPSFALDLEFLVTPNMGVIDGEDLIISEAGELTITYACGEVTVTRSTVIVYTPTSIALDVVYSNSRYIILTCDLYYQDQVSYNLSDVTIEGMIDDTWEDITDQVEINNNRITISNEGYSSIRITHVYDSDLTALIDL